MPMNPMFPSLYDLQPTRQPESGVLDLSALFGRKKQFDPTIQEHRPQLSAIEQGIMTGAYKDDEIASFAQRNPAAAPLIQQALQKRDIYRRNFQPAVSPNPVTEGEIIGSNLGAKTIDPNAQVSSYDQSRLKEAREGRESKVNLQGLVNDLIGAGQVDEATKLSTRLGEKEHRANSLTYAKIAEGYPPDYPDHLIPKDVAARILARSASPVVISTPTGNYAYPRGGVPGNPTNVPAYTPRPERAPEGVKESLAHNETNLQRVIDILDATDPNASKETKDRLRAQGISHDPSATGLKGILPDLILNRVDPQGTSVRVLIGDLSSMVIKDRSGAAVTAAEFPRLRRFIPDEKDNADTVRVKVRGFYRELSRMNDEIRKGYTPEQGYVPLPASSRQQDKPSTQPQSGPYDDAEKERRYQAFKRRQLGK